MTACVVHLLVPRRGHDDVLVAAGPPDAPALPVVGLPGEAGASPGTLLAALGTAAPVALVLGVQPLEEDEGGRLRVGLAETEPADEAPVGHAWRPVADVVAAAGPGPLRDGLERWHEAWAGGGTAAAPWYVAGWRDRTAAWIAGRLADLGRAPAGGAATAGAPVVVHAGPVSIVLRASAAGGPVFLKASIAHFAQEATILAALAGRTPGWVPDVLAADRAVGTLMDAMPGRMLADDPPGAWGRGLRRMAELQVAWLGHADELAQAGAQVRPLAGLAAAVDTMDAVHRELVALEPDAWVAWPAARPRLLDRCLALEASPVPETLVHGDLHPGNVQVDGDRTVLFDWSDGAVSHPFLDLAVFLRSVDDPATRRALVDAYLEPWLAGFDRAVLDAAVEDALVAGALYQVVTYRALLPAMDPRDRWQFEGAAARWLRAALRPPMVAPRR